MGGSDGRRIRRGAQQEHCMKSSQVKSVSREKSGAMHLQGGQVQVCSEIQRLGKWLGVRRRGSWTWH